MHNLPKMPRAGSAMHKENKLVDNGNFFNYYCDQHSEYCQPK